MCDNLNVEIFVLDPNNALVLKWVEARLGIPELVDQMEDIRIYHASFERVQVALTITPHMEGSDFTSLYFAGQRLPWATDVECARDAVRTQLGVVRCVPDGPHDEDQWLEVSEKGERLVVWETPS